MSIELTPEVEQMVLGIYSSGQFSSESEVVTVAVRMLHDRQELLTKLEQGRSELDHGQRLAAEAVFADLRARANELDGRGA